MLIITFYHYCCTLHYLIISIVIYTFCNMNLAYNVMPIFNRDTSMVILSVSLACVPLETATCLAQAFCYVHGL